MEAKLLQIAASLRTRFVLVISAEALKWLLAFLGHSPRFDPLTVYAGEWMRPHCEEAGEGKKGGSVTATYWKSLLKTLFLTVIAIALGLQTQKCLLHI
jgi:hypothetical protein